MAAAAAEKKDIKWLTAHLSETLGEDVDQIKVRQVLRKLAIEKTEGRYAFKGVNDPQVKLVVKEFKAAAKAPAAQKASTKTAPTTPAAKAPAKKTAASRKRPTKVAEPEEEVLEDDELDLD